MSSAMRWSGLSAAAPRRPMRECVGGGAPRATGVVRPPAEPLADVLPGQPAPPADQESRLDEILDDVAGDEDEGPEQEDGEEQRPEGGLVLVLDGVEPVPAEEVQAHADADLGLVDEDEKHH